jgi:hypothetical protein
MGSHQNFSRKVEQKNVWHNWGRVLGCGRDRNRVIWYNDIEDGFNCSSYVVAGRLAEYFCNQDELELAVQNLLPIIETGRDWTRRCSAPIPGKWQPRYEEQEPLSVSGPEPISVSGPASGHR